VITNFKKYKMNEKNIAPDFIIDTFYNRIKTKLENGYKKDNNIIKKELDRLILINGTIPDKIKDLLNDNQI